MRSGVKTAALLLALALVAALVAGCGGGATGGGEAQSGGDVIKVATVTPLSGSQAAIGESIKLGAQIALEEQKGEFEKLGFKLELAPQDDQADPKIGVTVAQKLIADKDVLAVVGHYNSGVAIPSSEVYVKDNLCMVSPGNTAPAITDRRLPNVNRICSRDDAQGPAGADFAKGLGAKKVFIIHDKTTYGQGIADEFKKRAEAVGLEVVGYEGITAGESDFSAVLNKVAGVKPDVVYFGGIYPEGSLIIKQMKDKEIAAKFIGPDGMDSAEVIKIAGDAAIGAYYTSVAGDVTRTEAGKKWAEQYKQKFNKDPENWSVYGYDAMNVVLEGIKNAIANNGGKKPTRQQVSEAVRAIQGFQGVATKVSFDEKGDNKDGMIFIYEFKEARYPAPVVKEIPAGVYLNK